MLEARQVQKGSPDVGNVKSLMNSVFPKMEQIPMYFLLSRTKEEFIDFLAYYDDNKFVGFAYLITDNDLTFIQYIAVDSTLHSKGYGSTILNQIKAQYPNNRIALNLETLDENAKNSEQRVKRRAFYAKNGYEDAGIITHVRGHTLDTLILGGTTTTEELQVVMKKFTGVIFGFLAKYRFRYAK